MPKERKTRSLSYGRRSRASPFLSHSSSHRGNSPSSSRNPHGSPLRTSAAKEIKEWEEARCPVCMEHPHNAVLLLCSSHDKGCRPFMCNTSYRHSNCLDQFRKAFVASCTSQDNHKDNQLMKLSCPLCRGFIRDWIVMEPARQYMNAKSRSCSMESCEFSGSYSELRAHARLVHPTVRPSVVDPEREREWRMMEQQRDMGDLLSTLRSAMGRNEAGQGNEEYQENVVTVPSVAIYFVLRVQRHPVRENSQPPRHHRHEAQSYDDWMLPVSSITSDSDYNDDDGGTEETSVSPGGR